MTSEAETAPSAPARLRRTASTSAWLLVLATVLLGFGVLASRPAAPPDLGPITDPGVAAAQHAVDGLLAPGPTTDVLARLPPDFTEVSGIRPAVEAAPDGTARAVHVGGGCSAPWGDDNTKWDYGPACRAHDLGYDLLRYAAKKGQPLAPPVREALDDRLSADMHGMCTVNPMNSYETCQVVASLYTAGLVVNSWHQRWGPPVGEPLGPMLAGVAVIGFLLAFRLSGWLRGRRLAAAVLLPDGKDVPEPAPERAAPGWAALGVASVVLLVLGESGIALAAWAGADAGWLWPVSWLTQLAFVFFFAGGHANARGWQAITGSRTGPGSGYRQFLAHRASWLLRPAMVFALVAYCVPLALELLRIPKGTNDTVLRIALHPLWLLGLYLLTVAATPVMLALHRAASAVRGGRVAVLLGLTGLVLLGEGAGALLGSPVPGYLAAFVLALLAQQLAFWHASAPSVPRWAPVLALAAGLAGLVLVSTMGNAPLLLLGTPGAPPAIAGPSASVLLLGIAQLGALALVSRPLASVAATAPARRLVVAALRAPMTLYLGFLAAMLLLVAAVYLRAPLLDTVHWLLRPRQLFALAMLAAPAVLVFWWFERHLPARPDPEPHQPARSRADTLLSRCAAVLGTGYAALGIFGLALTRFAAGTEGTSLLGLSLDPIQNLIHLLLGAFLLHTLRIGTSARATTWLLCAVACVPPVLSATSGDVPDPVGLAVHGLSSVVAVAAAVIARHAAAPRRVVTA